MADSVLVFEDIHLRSEEGKAIFNGLQWSMPRNANINLRVTSGGDATSLLKLAAGLIHPQKGRVLLDGVPLTPYSFDHPFLQRGALGWVPREGGLLVNQNLRANVALPLMFTKRMGRTEAEAVAAKALEQAGLAEAADHRPHALDPRERWLGALVRASVMEPELWLVDQPLQDLESTMQEAAAIILDRAAASPASMVVVGDESWIPWMSMQTIRLGNGRLIAEDS
jgi:predicted ABC-type transport system involved in lysophospholipase L1 biosynthesis ATPase subunit